MIIPSNKETILTFILDLFIVFSVFILGVFGYFHFLWDADVSKLSFLILGIFTITILSIAFEKVDPKTVYEIGNILFALGLAGTVIGFSYMFMSFDILAGSASDLKQVLPHFAVGVSTSLQTTLVALVANFFLRTKMLIKGNYES